MIDSYQEWWRDVPDETQQPSIFRNGAKSQKVI